MIINFIAIVLIAIRIIEARIKIDIESGGATNVSIRYSGFETFRLGESNLKEAVTKYYGQEPTYFFLKSPTPKADGPDGDMYKRFNWEQVKAVKSVKSARLKRSHVETAAVLEHDFENPSSNTIKVNIAIKQTMKNTISTSWSSSEAKTRSEEFAYDVNVNIIRISGSSGMSLTKNWGQSAEKTEALELEISSGVEFELKPGQAVKAVFSAQRHTLEIDVEYGVTLRGDVTSKFYWGYKGHYLYRVGVNNVLKSGGLLEERTYVETIYVSIFTDATLKFLDKNN